MEKWLWEDKYPAFKRLGKWEKKEYWAAVHDAHEQIYKGAAATVEDGDPERVQQLVAQTDKVSTREHFTKLEVRQLQDACLAEMGPGAVGAIVEDAGDAVMGATAARVGMFTKECTTGARCAGRTRTRCGCATSSTALWGWRPHRCGLNWDGPRSPVGTQVYRCQGEAGYRPHAQAGSLAASHSWTVFHLLDRLAILNHMKLFSGVTYWNHSYVALAGGGRRA